MKRRILSALCALSLALCLLASFFKCGFRLGFGSVQQVLGLGVRLFADLFQYGVKSRHGQPSFSS